MLTLAEFLEVLKNFGLPVASMVVMGVAIIVIAKWAARQWEWLKAEVILPVTTEHLEFVKNTARLMASLDQKLEKVRQADAATAAHVKKLLNKADEQSDVLKEQSGILVQIGSRLGPPSERA